jgi:hypothetical protein
MSNKKNKHTGLIVALVICIAITVTLIVFFGGNAQPMSPQSVKDVLQNLSAPAAHTPQTPISSSDEQKALDSLTAK